MQFHLPASCAERTIPRDAASELIIPPRSRGAGLVLRGPSGLGTLRTSRDDGRHYTRVFHDEGALYIFEAGSWCCSLAVSPKNQYKRNVDVYSTTLITHNCLQFPRLASQPLR